MARPLKSGLDYFPLDVDFLHDRKVRRIVRRNGCAGIAVIISLFCEIYRGKGYYVVWDEDLCFDISDQTECTADQVEIIFQSCLEARLFDPDLYASQHVLTSCALQQRYIKINQDCKRKRTIDPAYCLFPVGCMSQKENDEEGAASNADCSDTDHEKASSFSSESGIGQNQSAADRNFSTLSNNATSLQLMGAAAVYGSALEKGCEASELRDKRDCAVDSSESRNKRGDAAASESRNEKSSAFSSESGTDQNQSAADKKRVSSEVTRGEGRVSSEKTPQNKRKESKGQENKAQHSKREKNRPQQTAFSPAGKAEEGAAPPVVKSLSSSQNFDNQDNIEVKPILKLNLDALNVKNAKTVQAINALSQRPEIGGLNGVLWKVLSMQYRPLLVRKENPGDYILWALNHPEMFTETYTHLLQKKCRG
ncbi:Lin1244/Lin1753 domain-containing protein [uncultured Bacteroides sp.]|uniref:DUF4373 domain-containing protein n=1 Tax=uncultured Bacteroides sp. TaxID=162156 RepID=UPI002AAB67B2|nr:Lin1244/Lin1753 domain-containing protein [uncultured Bacteroides sp.]